MTGKSRELADFMQRRRIGVLFVQQTRWKGNKSRDLEDGCKFIYSISNSYGRNRVGIILNEWKEHLVRVTRRSDRIMCVQPNTGNTNVNIICAYAPQVGCEEQEKEEFWRALYCEILEIPVDEKCFIGGDF
ncbi:uncharacterized protein [Diabrotica undecimpunctata]|uniref:uncharacterized protein n=1 Tax=Diabrotica undecimpunctata TaxID=50387 RepID=UPI003B63BC0B